MKCGLLSICFFSSIFKGNGLPRDFISITDLGRVVDFADQWLPGAGCASRLPSSVRDLCGVMEIFYILIVVLVTLLYALAKSQRTRH